MQILFSLQANELHFLDKSNVFKQFMNCPMHKLLVKIQFAKLAYNRDILNVPELEKKGKSQWKSIHISGDICDSRKSG